MVNRIDQNHDDKRAALRFIGPVMLIVGVIFTAIGMVSFFASMGSHSGPSYFWCAFIGLPLMAFGSMISKFGYLGSISRYVAGETAPVGKDVVNYMATETKGAIREISAAVGQGLRSAETPENGPQIARCPQCHADNEITANFCKACGVPLPKSKPCPDCHEVNAPDARFCDNCGKAIP